MPLTSAGAMHPISRCSPTSGARRTRSRAPRSGALRTLRSGGKIQQGRVIGDAAQLGGALVITPDGRVAWSHMSEHAGDNASADEILAAARAAATARPGPA
jgi:hypothetical protein